MGRKIIISEEQAKSIIKHKLHEVCSYALSEVGEIWCTLNFDEEEYQEYLADNGLQDNQQTREAYVREKCNYDVELKDSETQHQCGYEVMTIEQIQQNFGANVANDVFRDCMDGAEHQYDLLGYDNETVDLTNPVELSNAAMARLQHGEYYKDCRGFILPNGVVVYTGSEHNMSSQVPGVSGTYHFINLGCIRLLDHSIDMAVKPTGQQWETLNDVFDAYMGGENVETISLDLMNQQIGYASKKYVMYDSQEIKEDIYNYFNNGILPRKEIYGMYESVFAGKKSDFDKWVIKEGVEEKQLYHGSCADFDQFDEKYVLSGVGHMDFGYGFYLTDSKNTAHDYALGGKLYTVEVPDGKYLNANRISRSEAMSVARNFYKYYLQTDYGKEAYAGHEQEFWDYECKYVAEATDGNSIYGSISSILGSDKDTSAYLRSLGYLGLEIDGDNGTTGEVFKNYLIFSQNDIKIVSKTDF